MDLIKFDNLDDQWLGVGDTTKVPVDFNPLYHKINNFPDDIPGLFETHLLKQPDYLACAARVFLNVGMTPQKAAILEEMWKRPFPLIVACRGFGKTWIMAVYALLRALLLPDYKIVIAGAAFRQSKLTFEYMEKIWYNAPILRSVCNKNSGPTHGVDRWTFTINGSSVIAIPIGAGNTIRGLRANTILADEFASHDPDIYETVIAGFGSVTADAFESMKADARASYMKEKGLWNADIENSNLFKIGNQSIITGTAYYHFNHFYHYWQRYKKIVESRGDTKKLEEILEGEVPKGFDWRKYSVIRIPYELIPEGIMDADVISRAKATVPHYIYLMEYSAVFAEDSEGFYKRSLINRRVASEKNINNGYIPYWCPAPFDPLLTGDPNKKYVFGVDAASERDNFAIVVLEIQKEHARIVYCWTTRRDKFEKRVKSGFDGEDDFFQFCARKIRDLMRVFPCRRIGMDAQGGGRVIQQALQSSKNLQHGEERIWEVVDPDKPKESDLYPGLKILEMVEFARAEWTSTANHGMRQDLETGVLLFPRMDPVSIELAIAQDKIYAEKFTKDNPGQKWIAYDTFEDCVMEIEELKDELSTIKMERTGAGVQSREKWTTPEKIENGKKINMRKDRYSALLIANMLARELDRDVPTIPYKSTGGLVQSFTKTDSTSLYASAPEKYKQAMENNNYIGIVR